MSLENITAILETNPDAITGVGTLLLATATLLLVFVNFKLWHAQDKPWLSFKLQKEEQNEGKSPKFLLYVMNFGKGIALDINFRPYRIINNSKYSICTNSDRKSGPKICCLLESLYPTEKRFVLEIIRMPLMEDVNSHPVVSIGDIKYKDVNGFTKKQDEQIIQYEEK